MDAVEKSRHAARAASLGLLPGLGHLYIGEKRGYWLITTSIGVGGLALLLWWPAVWLYLGLAAASAWDTYLLVTRDQGLW
jgi:hypothetical protein